VYGGDDLGVVDPSQVNRGTPGLVWPPGAVASTLVVYDHAEVVAAVAEREP
jgi:hypothetical protein